MYISTSTDILNFVLAFSILWIVILLTWFLWHAIVVVRTIRARIREIEEVFQHLREKLESTSTYLGLLVDVVREGMQWYREREEKPSKKKKKYVV